MALQEQSPTGLTADSPDEALVAAFRDGGDPMAYEVLLRRYQRPIYGFIRRQVGDRALAEELFQETFLKVYDRIKSCRDPAAFKSWVFSIAANLCRNQVRRQAVRQGEVPQGQMNGHSATGQDPESSAMSAELRLRIEQGLDSLSEAQREVFLLYHFTRLSYEEIAEALEVPLGTVKSRMSTALTRLRDLLCGLKEGR